MYEANRSREAERRQTCAVIDKIDTPRRNRATPRLHTRELGCLNIPRRCAREENANAMGSMMGAAELAAPS